MSKIKKSIRKAYDQLPCSIINTAKSYPEGRNILIGILKRDTNRSAKEIVEWLDKQKLGICKLNEYRINDKHRGK